MSDKIRIVHLEDVREDSELVAALLAEGGISCDLRRVETEARFLEALADPTLQMILADYSLPSFDGLRALELAHQKRPEIPFLFVTGALQDDRAVEALRMGATDFVVKQRLNRLVPCVRRALRESAERLEKERLDREVKEAVRAREDLLAIVSHDLRNPLNSILTAATLLQKDDGSFNADARSRYLDTISRSAERMHRLISDLLEMAKIDSGTIVLDHKIHAVDELIDDVVDMLSAASAQKGVQLQTHATPGITLGCDRERVGQILANLVSNAVKFTPEGGRVSIGAKAVGDGIEFEVSDNGPGIDPEDLGHLFDRYWQAREWTRKQSGVGLGLSIVKGLVEAHQGRISVESERGRGTTFRFVLPLRENATHAERRPRRAGFASGPTILIVDDDADILATVAEILEDRGYRVVTAKNGREALDELRRADTPPAVILLDVMMPVMDGIAFRQEQERDPRLGGIPVVVFSASRDVGGVAAQLGAAGHLTKPVKPELLVSTIGRLAADSDGRRAMRRT